jgi:tetratricopeptide (TPR) repeat protein
MGQFEKALTVARKALELDGSSTDAIIRYANVSLYNGHINEAISSLEDLLKKIPQHPSAQITLIAAYAMADMEEKSISLLEKLQEKKYDWVGTLCVILKNLLAAGRSTYAIRAVESIEKYGYIIPQFQDLFEECCVREKSDDSA